MINKVTQLDIFDSYVHNEMASKDRDQFDERLKEDEQFRQSFENYKKAVEAIKIKGFSEELKQIRADRKEKNQVINWKLYGSIAASLLILISGYFIFQNDQPVISNEYMYDEYYTPYPNINAMRGTEKLSELEIALNYYTNQNYQEAISHFQLSEKGQDTTKFYLALSYLSLKNGELALQELNRISKKSIFEPQVNWYKCLAFLLVNNHDSLNYQIRALKEGDFRFREASELNSKLSK